MNAQPLASAGDVLLDVRHLVVELPRGADRLRAVDAISFELKRNEILCIVGESGSGKSITAQAILGLLPQPQVRATAGEILFRGKDLLRARPSEMRAIRGARIAMIFQEPMTALHPIMKIGDQIAETIQEHVAMTRDARARRVRELLEAVGLPEPERLRSTYPFRLSGGQRQRVMIAMALALEPDVLIADEPTTALDVTTQAQILRLIKDIQAARHMGVLLITHDFGVVAEVADRVAVMQDGRIVEIAEADQILNRPQHPYTRALIAAVPRLQAAERMHAADAPVILSARNVRKTYRSRSGLFARRDEVAAVKGVSLDLKRGETIGLVGESGSGKSTFARCVIRLIDSEEGEILFQGVDINGLSRRALRPYRKRIQMVFQDPYASLNPRRLVGRIIAEGPQAHGVAERQAMERAYQLLELVGLERQSASRYPHEFSGGQRQRIGLARALALDPDILVADEPVSALDVSVQAQVLRLLDDIRHRFELAMLFITHDLRVAAQVCDAIAVMRHGEIVEHRRTADLFADPHHEYTRELLAAVPGRGWVPPVAAVPAEGVANQRPA
jgi:ABC-type microcin C transport system duplicated ATPase subunit YejF